MQLKGQGQQHKQEHDNKNSFELFGKCLIYIYIKCSLIIIILDLIKYLMQKVAIDKDISVVDPVSIIQPVRVVVIL